MRMHLPPLSPRGFHGRSTAFDADEFICDRLYDWRVTTDALQPCGTSGPWITRHRLYHLWGQLVNL